MAKKTLKDLPGFELRNTEVWVCRGGTDQYIPATGAERLALCASDRALFQSVVAQIEKEKRDAEARQHQLTQAFVASIALEEENAETDEDRERERHLTFVRE